MTNEIACTCCGTHLSYGEAFRHQMSLDVASGDTATVCILGDRLSPRRPMLLCRPCRVETIEMPRPQPTYRASWFTPLVATAASAVMLMLALRGRS